MNSGSLGDALGSVERNYQQEMQNMFELVNL